MKKYKLTRLGKIVLSIVLLLGIIMIYFGIKGVLHNRSNHQLIQTSFKHIDKVESKEVMNHSTNQAFGEISTPTLNYDNGLMGLTNIFVYLPSPNKKQIRKSNVEIFYIPHPDDELLSMGAAIAKSIKAGREVHVVLFTHGYESNALKVLNGNVYCKVHKRVHLPNKEKYKEMSDKDLGSLRVKEFLKSTEELGVKKGNVHVMNFDADSVTPYEIKLIMLGFEMQFNGAVHNTTSYYDTHPFHKKLANTLLELFHNNEISQALFFISPVQWNSVKGSFVEAEETEVNIKNGIKVYQLWDPKRFCFGIGYHSYQQPFTILNSHTASKTHKPNE